MTNAVLSLVDANSQSQPLLTGDTGRLEASLHLLIGFFVGCVVAAAALLLLGDGFGYFLPRSRG